MKRAKLIENPRASKSDAPNIENLNALIIYSIGFASDTVCQIAGKSWME